MPNIPRILLLLGLAAFVLGLTAPGAVAQVTREKPVMQNTFFNVIWGSAAGALLGASSAALGPGTDVSPAVLRESVITGATAGGVLGLGIGIWLTFNGITFDPDRSLIFGSLGPGPTASQGLLPPLVIETEPGKPFHITGAKALILDLRF